MGNGLSIATIQDHNRTPYTLFAGHLVEADNHIYNLTKIIDAGMSFPVSGGAFYPAYCRNSCYEAIDIAEYNSANDRYCVVERIQVASNRFKGDPQGYPLICRAEYLNTNILIIKISDGKSNAVLVKKKIYIRRKGQDYSELESNNVIRCTGMPVSEDVCKYVPYAVGFVRCRSNNTKWGNRYEKLDFVPCKPYFEQFIRKPAQFGMSFEDFTHVDKCEDGSPVLEIAEYSDHDYVMKTMGKIHLKHTRYTEVGALSSRGHMCVNLLAYYIDRNTIFLTVTEKSELKKHKTDYVLDIDRTIIEDAVVPVVPSIPVEDNKEDKNEKNATVLDKVDQRFRTRNMDDSLMAINSLIGLNSVKSRIQTMTAHIIYEQMRADKLGIPFEAECPRFIFTGNPGTGKTTVARLLASIYKDVGLLSKGQLVEVDRKDLVAEYIGQTAIKTHNVCESAYGGVLFVDEAYELYNESGRDFGAEAIATLLTEMENHRKDFIVVFAGYSGEMNMLLDTNTGLKSRITDTLYFPDYTEEELCKIAKMMAGDNHYTITDEGMAAFRMAVSKKMVDRKFGNGREVRNLINSAMQRHGERYLRNNSLGMTTLSAEDFGIDLNVNIRGVVSNYLNELDAMAGLCSVKEEVRNAINRASYILKETKAGAMSIDDYDMNLNLCFTGNPGTGKTTVARLYAKILYAIGFAKTGNFIEAARENFVGFHQGETAIKTRNLCEKAYGGVLFIDEAYSLAQSDHDEVGKEALATLIKEMENNRKKLIVIFAGYTAEMQEFMNQNSGLKSRISKFIEFEDYDRDELMTIFESFANHGRVIISDEAYPVIKSVISYMVDNKDRNFGNAREMRNLYEDIWANMVTRVEEQGLTGKERRTIRPEDVRYGF